MKLSVIIPTYNEEKYLPRLLECLNGQTYQPHEIIVADSSDDSTPELAKAAGAKVARTEKVGPSRNRNVGGNAATGDILLFLDADTNFDNNFLENVHKEFVSKKVDMGMIQFKFDSTHLFDISLGLKMNLATRLMQWIRPFTHGFSIICTKEVFNKLNGFDESLKMAEDVDFGYRGSKLGKYRVLTSTKILISPRRLKEEGRWHLLAKWIKTSVLTLRGKKIKNDDESVDYTFGKHE